MAENILLQRLLKASGLVGLPSEKVIPLLLISHPKASFSFAASRSVDIRTKTQEQRNYTQRFRLYSYMIPTKFGPETAIERWMH